MLILPYRLFYANTVLYCAFLGCTARRMEFLSIKKKNDSQIGHVKCIIDEMSGIW